MLADSRLSYGFNALLHLLQYWHSNSIHTLAVGIYGHNIKASQEYEGAAWAAYNIAYRQQAAATGHRQWSEVNTSLYAVCFTGRGKRALRCEVCLSKGHH